VLLHSLELKNVAKRASNLTEAVHLRILQYRKPKTTRSKNLRIQKKRKKKLTIIVHYVEEKSPIKMKSTK
jgi:hypothetical protein